ncbi:hypothetical protein CSE16_11990 [Solibacillus sp. R5-41]|uniref:hypothetical protein n=1 Tax=Solibacillus sp. R5-41 TaxID=2048654 RepID=UPI000C128727|nr:hypothetical protein [Solibacillus sp. R5-41]ATP40710.1 hypothetical protein CSE16_11990 [Solibacillus sp. R5-41]
MGILEKVFFTIISLAVVVSLYFLEITLKDIGNFDNVLLGTITLNSIGIGFLVASVSMIPSLSENEFFKKLKELKTDQKLMRLLIVTIRFLLLISIISLVLLFTNTIGQIQEYLEWLFYLWIFLLTFSLLLINSVVKIFLTVVKSIQEKG